MYSVIWDTKWQMNSGSNATNINSNCFQLQTDSKNRSQQQKPKFIPVNGTNKKCLVVVSALSDLSTSSINKKKFFKKPTDKQTERKTVGWTTYTKMKQIPMWYSIKDPSWTYILAFLPKKSHALVWISFITNYLST